jgi:hypothetical protein
MKEDELKASIGTAKAKGGRVRSINRGTIKGYDDGNDIGVGTVQLSCKGGASLTMKEDELKASTGEAAKGWES